MSWEEETDQEASYDGFLKRVVHGWRVIFWEDMTLEGYVSLLVGGARPGQRPGLYLPDPPQPPWGSEPHPVGLRMCQF